MTLRSVPAAGRQLVERYGEGLFRISGAEHAGSVLVLPDRTIPWPVAAFAEIGIAEVDAIAEAAAGAQILLIGCGAKGAFLAPGLRARLRAAGMVADAMDTGAACRTYNVLVGEDRRVAAALIAL